MKKVLWLFKLKEDFIFMEHYTELLAKKFMEEGYELHIYDYRKRKLYNMSDKTIEFQSNWLNIIDRTLLRVLVNFLCFLAFCSKYRNKFDIVHILYIRIEFLFVSRLIRSLGSKLALTMFGSDIHFLVLFHRLFSSLYLKADILHSTILETFNYFLNRFPQYEVRQKFISKHRTLAMPLASLTMIKSEQDREFVNNILAKYQIQEDDLVIVCGTTANTELEQYYDLVNAISAIDLSVYKNIKFIFTLTYGGNNRSRLRLKKHIANGLQSKQVIVIEQYLPILELIVLRKRTDIFINVRKHDQLVGSMIEAFLCKSEVIAGDWLPYGILDENEVYYHRISKVEDISSVLPIVILDRIKQLNEDKLQMNGNIMMQLWGPEKTLHEWHSFYQTLNQP